MITKINRNYLEIKSIDELKTISEDEAITFVPLAWNFFDEIKQRITAVRNGKNDKFIRYFPRAELI